MLDLENIPLVLTSYQHWVVWRYETRHGKTTKSPINARTGGGAMSNQKSTWSTFEQARERFYRDEQYNGLGFMLGVESIGLIGVDLDHCRDRETRDIADWAWEIVEDLGTYTEISPSGEGLRCLGFGDLPQAQGLQKGGFSSYNQDRFIPITANALGMAHNELRDIAEPLRTVHQRFEPQAAKHPTIRRCAVEARRHGLSVMPVSRDKRPLVKWTAYQKELPSLGEVDWWFSGLFPWANLGLITGALSGRFVVETDSEEAYDYIISRGIPPCPEIQSSQPWKRHFHFKHPGFEVSNSVSKLFPGVDVRGDGGYAVLPPSVHKTGMPYQWIVPPKAVALPDAPDWILEAVRKPEFVPSFDPVPVLDLAGETDRLRRYALRAFEGEIDKVKFAPDGTKADQLFKSAASIAEFIPHHLLSDSEIEEGFFAAVAGRAKDKANARQTIRNAIRRGSLKARRLPDTAVYSPRTG